MNKQRLLFVIRHSPYGNLLAKEGLDAVLTASVYEQTLSLLFLDEGVLQLTAQQTTTSEQKNISKLLSALSLYGINEVCVCHASLQERGLSVNELCIAVQPLNNDEIKCLMQQQDQLISF